MYKRKGGDYIVNRIGSASEVVGIKIHKAAGGFLKDAQIAHRHGHSIHHQNLGHVKGFLNKKEVKY